jgi:hypothetical protein
MLLGPADTFWARLLDLTATVPDLLSAVCQHMSNFDRKSLHSVNRAMRAAMNATVTRISCTQHTLPAHQQLHEVFPNLSAMAVRFLGTDARWVWVDEWSVYLQQLASSSELLLNRLAHLSLTIRPTYEAEVLPILDLLTRWASSEPGCVPGGPSCLPMSASVLQQSTYITMERSSGHTSPRLHATTCAIASCLSAAPASSRSLAVPTRCLCLAVPWYCGAAAVSMWWACLGHSTPAHDRTTMAPIPARSRASVLLRCTSLGSSSHVT